MTSALDASAGSGAARVTSRYSVIYADPAWPYRDRASAGARGASHKYAVLSEAQLGALPVAELAAPDCALFLWATPPNLPLALRVMASWGFAYKTVAFTWVKTSRDGFRFPIGMGHWTRANAELVLLGVRGRPKRVSAAVHSLVIAPRREHSRKPEAVRERIVQLMGDVPRVELFPRGSVPAGWESWTPLLS